MSKKRINAAIFLTSSFTVLVHAAAWSSKEGHAASGAMAGINQDLKLVSETPRFVPEEKQELMHSADIKALLNASLAGVNGRPRSGSAAKFVKEFEELMARGALELPAAAQPPVVVAPIDPFQNAHQRFFTSQYDLAISDYSRLLQADLGTTVERRKAYTGLGECYLGIEDFHNGFIFRDKRLTAEAGKDLTRLWDGQTDLNGKTLLIRPEGGFGDIAFFQLRWVPCVQRAFPGCNIVLEGNFVEQSICKLLKNVTVQKTGICQDYDAAIYGMSLPRYFGVHGGLINRAAVGPQFQTKPYISGNPALVQKWMERLKPLVEKGIMPIAIFWGASANPGGVFRPYDRDIKPELLIKTLRECGNVALFNLQGPGSEAIEKEFNLMGDPDFDKSAGPFQDTVAVLEAIKNYDGLAVGIDTAALNFAGGVGVDTYAVLPEFSDWRWGTNQVTSTFFPSIEMIRQKKQGDWSTVLHELQVQVTDWVSTWVRDHPLTV